MKLRLFAVGLAANLAALSAASALDQKLPAYQASTNSLAGHLKSVGSDSLGNEMTLWAKEFMDRYPNVKIDIEAKGSVTAPPALFDGTSQLAPMSRPMTSEELAEFKAKYGYVPSQVRVAVDALAVYVNKDNPIACLTLQQLNRIFSTTRRAAFGNDIATWGDAGLTGEWAAKPIVLYGRNTLSGTYEFFREMALYDGTYKPELKQQPGSEAVVQNVANDKYAIGYSGLGYKTNGVRTVPLASSPGAECYETSAEAAYSHKYPLARYLYIYVNKKPDQPLDPLLGEFIKYVLSKDGQAQTEKGGYYSITNTMREQDLKKLGMANVSD